MANLIVSAVTTFDGKALKKGSKEIDAFTSGAKRLGRELTAAFSVVALERFAKASVKAFAADEKQIAILTQTLKNAGQEMSAMSVNHFVDNLMLATGVVKTELIPAFDKLFLATGSVTKSQEMLKLAMDVSAGTGKDLNTVAQALSKGLLGNTTSLTRLGAGLDKALLKTGDMVKITAVLAKKFSGDAAAAADTFAGKLARIGAAVEIAKIKIGEGLVSALMKATASTTIDELQTRIIQFGLNASNAMVKLGTFLQSNLDALKLMGATMLVIWGGGKIIAGIAIMTKAIEGLTFAYAVLQTTAIGASIAEAFASGGVSMLAGEAAALAAAGMLAVLINHLDKTTAVLNKMQAPNARVKDMGINGGDVSPQSSAADKLFAQQVANQKKLAAQQALQAKKDAALKLSLAKGNAIFDLNQIEIAAALKSTYDLETRKRLILLQAIQEENQTKIDAAIKDLADFQNNNDLKRLAGIKGITDAQLSAINVQLLADLNAIDKSKMSEADKYAARDEAFKKYAAAVNTLGGIEADQTHNATVAAQLAAIYQIRLIQDIAAAQFAADSAKQDALDKYLNTLKGAFAASGAALPGANPLGPEDLPYNPRMPNTNNGTGNAMADLGPMPSVITPVTGYGPTPTGPGVAVLPVIMSDTAGFTDAVNKAVQNASRNGWPSAGYASQQFVP